MNNIQKLLVFGMGASSLSAKQPKQIPQSRERAEQIVVPSQMVRFPRLEIKTPLVL